jgi:hypothetical protein
LLLHLLLLAIGFAALRYPAVYFASAIYSGTLCLVAINAILACTRVRRRRDFHISFAIASSLYLFAALNSRDSEYKHLLGTQQLFHAVEEYFPTHDIEYPVPPPAIPTLVPGRVAERDSPVPFRTDHLLAIWHCIFAVALGEIAGLVVVTLKQQEQPSGNRYGD